MVGKDGMNELFGRFPGLHRYAIILEWAAPKPSGWARSNRRSDGMSGR